MRSKSVFLVLAILENLTFLAFFDVSRHLLSFQTLNQEENTLPIHVLETESRHVEDNNSLFVRRSSQKTSILHGQEDELL